MITSIPTIIKHWQTTHHVKQSGVRAKIVFAHTPIFIGNNEDEAILMNNPYEKYIRFELFAIIGAIFLTMIALIKGSKLFIIVALFLLIISLFFEALLEMSSNQQITALKHVVRATLFLILIGYFLFHSAF